MYMVPPNILEKKLVEWETTDVSGMELFSDEMVEMEKMSNGPQQLINLKS